MIFLGGQNRFTIFAAASPLPSDRLGRAGADAAARKPEVTLPRDEKFLGPWGNPKTVWASLRTAPPARYNTPSTPSNRGHGNLSAKFLKDARYAGRRVYVESGRGIYKDRR